MGIAPTGALSLLMVRSASLREDAAPQDEGQSAVSSNNCRISVVIRPSAEASSFMIVKREKRKWLIKV
jgi:hypothetical protein